jgi:hypothetical protein
MSNYELILQQPPKTYFVPNYIFVITWITNTPDRNEYYT